MEIDLNRGTFPWSLINVMQEPAAVTEGAVIRTVFDQACNAMFYTNQFQTDFMRHSMAINKYELCKTMRRKEDHHYLRQQLYRATKTKLIQHEHLLCNIQVDAPNEEHRESLNTAIEHAKEHFSQKRGRAFIHDLEAQIFYSKAVALFARDELALPLHKIPHVSKSMVSRILLNEPRPKTLLPVVPEEVLKCPAEVGRYLFLKNANNRAAVKLDKFKRYLLTRMLEYVANVEGVPYSQVEVAAAELDTVRVKEGRDIQEDLYLLWIENKLPGDLVVDDSFSYHLLDPTDYISKIDQIKNPTLPSDLKHSRTRSTAHTLSTSDDTSNPFYFEENQWVNLLDAAMYMVCKRMDPGITTDTYKRLKQQLASIEDLYHLVFDTNFKDVFAHNIKTFLSRKYAMNPPVYILMKIATSRPYNAQLVCKTNVLELDAIVADVANGLIRDQALHTGLFSVSYSEPVDIDNLTNNALTNAWLSEMCMHRSDDTQLHHGYTTRPAWRPPTDDEVRLFVTFGCSKRMKVGWARVINQWKQPHLLRVRTVGEFATYLCNNYILKNIINV